MKRISKFLILEKFIQKSWMKKTRKDLQKKYRKREVSYFNRCMELGLITGNAQLNQQN